MWIFGKGAGTRGGPGRRAGRLGNGNKLPKAAEGCRDGVRAKRKDDRAHVVLKGGQGETIYFWFMVVCRLLLVAETGILWKYWITPFPT